VPLSEPKGVRGEVGGRVGGSFWTPGGTNSSKFRSLRKAPPGSIGNLTGPVFWDAACVPQDMGGVILLYRHERSASGTLVALVSTTVTL
jgi:hypothetical protein